MNDTPLSLAPLLLDAKGVERLGFGLTAMVVVAFSAYVLNAYAETSRRAYAKSAFLKKAIDAGVDMATVAAFAAMENPAINALVRIASGDIDEVLAARLRPAIAAGI